jgi:hypothetical protein
VQELEPRMPLGLERAFDGFEAGSVEHEQGTPCQALKGSAYSPLVLAAV